MASDIKVSLLSATGGLDHIALIAISAPPDDMECLVYMQPVKVEIWAATSNNRANAVKVGESASGLFDHTGLPTPTTRYYWARAVDLSGNVGDFYPVSATGGISATTTLGTAQNAINQFTKAHQAVVALGDGIDLARSNARWSLRGRFVAREVAEMAGRYDRRGIRLYASALLFGEALGNALRKKETPPPLWITEALQTVIDNCTLVDGGEPRRIPPLPDDIPFVWRDTAHRLQSVQDTLLHFLHSRMPDSVPIPSPGAARTERGAE